uniref:HTH_Tnp_Tc3_2 domain-containing protein n=1 Tax=Rhodnius prolixus TaxID=13249 RepID=T1HA60_RHOPR
MANDLASSSGKSVSSQTIRNILHNEGIKGRRPRKKPVLSEINQKKRKGFVEVCWLEVSS